MNFIPFSKNFSLRFRLQNLTKPLSLAFTFILVLLFVSCGGSNPSQQTDPNLTPLQNKKFRVALLSPGPIDDNGWNALGYEALKMIEKELNADISQQQVKSSPADREQGYRDYAARGYNMVIGHGGEFMDQALTVAKEFPNTTFVVMSGDRSASNVVSVVFDLGQASYLAGALAAQLSKTGKAGAVGGMDIPASTRTLIAFRNGAKAIKPNFDVTIAYVGNWEDAAAARQQTLALIDKGADCIIHDCDAAAAGVFQAVKERNVMAFGVQKDQSSLAPDNVIMSVINRIPEGMTHVAQQIKNGSQKGEVVHLGIKDNAIQFVMNSHLKDGRITPDIESKLNQLMKEIREGKIDVFKE